MSTKVVYTVVEREGGRSYWTRVGTATENKDGSLVVQLDAFPVSGLLQIRDAVEEGARQPNLTRDPTRAHHYGSDGTCEACGARPFSTENRFCPGRTAP